MTGRPAIPVTVIGGFLGAGKTTLLNHLLRTAGDRRLAVVVNDFGSINIDAGLIDSQAGDTIDLSNGCVCCSLGGELLFTLAGLRDRDDPPGHVVIEASGISDPGGVASHAAIPGFVHDGTVVVVDAETVRERASERVTAGQIRDQLKSAQLLVLNKTDRVDPTSLGRTRAWLEETAPYAGIVETVYGAVPASVLLGVHAEDGVPAGHSHGAEHDWASWSWSGNAAVNGTALTKELPELPVGVLRGKGTLHLLEDPGSRYAFQLVGRTWYIQKAGAWGDQVPRSQIVLIGRPDAIDSGELDAMMAGLLPAGR